MVVLHQDDTAIYTENPLRDWAELADDIDLVILPGRDHAMLEEPGVARLADIVRERLASVPRASEPAISWHQSSSGPR